MFKGAGAQFEISSWGPKSQVIPLAVHALKMIKDSAEKSGTCFWSAHHLKAGTEGKRRLSFCFQ